MQNKNKVLQELNFKLIVVELFIFYDIMFRFRCSTVQTPMTQPRRRCTSGPDRTRVRRRSFTSWTSFMQCASTERWTLRENRGPPIHISHSTHTRYVTVRRLSFTSWTSFMQCASTEHWTLRENRDPPTHISYPTHIRYYENTACQQIIWSWKGRWCLSRVTVV